jgi:phospholipase/carboxylesterase
MTIGHRTRPAAGEPEGTIVLFHGRGADEHDLVPLFDLLDPERRLVGITPRGPLSLPPGGAHWYALHRLGYPDPQTFHETFPAVAAWLGSLELDWSRTILGGFSQGTVMSYALGLARGRPRPAGILAFSGFVPTVPELELDLEPPLPPVAIGHGTYDPVIGVEWGRRAKETLEAAGADVTYRESPLPHAIDPRYATELARWIRAALATPAAR